MPDASGRRVWEQRWHPLRGEWLLFCSHRGGRPWIGDTHRAAATRPPSFDPTCALCPGNARLSGLRNEEYTGPTWFPNDLPCFGASPPSPTGDPLYQTRVAAGTAEVVCYHPRHDKVFAELTPGECAAVVGLWRDRYSRLAARDDVDHVLIFENKGALVGTSNPHPHCQIYAGTMIYGHTARHVAQSRAWHEETGGNLGLAIVDREIAGGRVVCDNDDFIACVPWFASYAYEVYVLPRRAVANLSDLADREVVALGALLREVAVRLDNLWRQPMPYIMVVHQSPTDGKDYSFFPFHVVFHPPLRKPDTLKYLAGPEVGGGSMTNESDPDEKAAELRAVSPVHYLAGSDD